MAFVTLLFVQVLLPIHLGVQDAQDQNSGVRFFEKYLVPIACARPAGESNTNAVQVLYERCTGRVLGQFPYEVPNEASVSVGLVSTPGFKVVVVILYAVGFGLTGISN